MCDVVKASGFEEAKNLLETESFDLAVLDIAGVNGYELLEIANRRKVIAAMLTAHALTPEDTMRSYKGGAASYIPKDRMADIEVFLNDILEGELRGKSRWWRWNKRLGKYFQKKFGSDWMTYEEFWKEAMKEKALKDKGL
jgi:DNA-binding NtrC family response regulator